MATPVLTSIISTIVAGLKTLTIVGGYNYNLTAVDDEFLFPDDSIASTAFPMVSVIAGEEAYEDDFAGIETVTVSVWLFCYVYDLTTPRASLLKLKQDITKWLRANETVSGYCTMAQLKAVDMSGNVFAPMGYGQVPVTKPYGAMRIDVAIKYDFSLSSGA